MQLFLVRHGIAAELLSAGHPASPVVEVDALGPAGTPEGVRAALGAYSAVASVG